MEEAGPSSKKKPPKKTSSEETEKSPAKKSSSATSESGSKKAAETSSAESQEQAAVSATPEPEDETPKKSKAAAAAASATPPAQAETPKENAPAATGEAAPETAKEADVTDNTLLPATRGKTGIFGGPKDRSIKPDDKLALPIGRHFTYERARSLNWKSFYCAMRWNYRLLHMSPEEGKRWWANKKLTLTNPATGKSVVVRAVDYGPHENSGLDILISPGASEAIGIEAGGEVEIAFADQKAPLGPVE